MESPSSLILATRTPPSMMIKSCACNSCCGKMVEDVPSENVLGSSMWPLKSGLICDTGQHTNESPREQKVPFRKRNKPFVGYCTNLRFATATFYCTSQGNLFSSNNIVCLLPICRRRYVCHHRDPSLSTQVNGIQDAS